MTGQIIEEAQTLKSELQAKFANKPRAFADAVIRVAHILLIAEADECDGIETERFAERTLGKLSGRTVEALRA